MFSLTIRMLASSMLYHSRCVVNWSIRSIKISISSQVANLSSAVLSSETKKNFLSLVIPKAQQKSHEPWFCEKRHSAVRLCVKKKKHLLTFFQFNWVSKVFAGQMFEFHFCLQRITKSLLAEWNQERPTIGILPTALFAGLEGQPYANQSNIFVVPYSDHSSYKGTAHYALSFPNSFAVLWLSTDFLLNLHWTAICFSELHKFVRMVKPKSVMPIVSGKGGHGMFSIDTAAR